MTLLARATIKSLGTARAGPPEAPRSARLIGGSGTNTMSYVSTNPRPRAGPRASNPSTSPSPAAHPCLRIRPATQPEPKVGVPTACAGVGPAGAGGAAVPAACAGVGPAGAGAAGMLAGSVATGKVRGPGNNELSPL